MTLSSIWCQARRPGKVARARWQERLGEECEQLPHSFEQLPSLAAYALIIATFSISEAIGQ